MSDEKAVNAEALLDFNEKWFSETQSADGGGFARHPWGDYRFRIESMEIKPSKGPTPHNMMSFTFKTIAVAGEGNAEAIGMAESGLYGTPQSPKFMQQRAHQLLTAIGITGKFTASMLIGKEFDGTVTWEKSAPTISATGEEKVFVNSRVAFERKPGTQKPPKAQAKALSAAAIAYVNESEGAAASAPGGEGQSAEVPAWEQKTEAVKAAATATATANTKADHVWMDEEKIPAAAHAFRAVIALKKPDQDTRRASLLAKNINPEGPIKADLITPVTLRTEYSTWLAAQAPVAVEDELGGLGLDDAPAVAADNGAAAPKAKTGTRSKAGTATA